MAKLSINDYLDELAESIMQENTTKEELETLTKKTKLITSIATEITKTKAVNFKIAKAFSDGDINIESIEKAQKVLKN
jgi:hypothetical protein